MAEFVRLVGFTLAGVVAGEGSFLAARAGTFADGSPKQRFVFSMTTASRDRPLLDALRTFLQAGSICDHPRRQPGWLPTSTFTINSRRAHHRATIPFAETFLLPSAKERQFRATGW